jgi:hypothetical protein
MFEHWYKNVIFWSKYDNFKFFFFVMWWYWAIFPKTGKDLFLVGDCKKNEVNNLITLSKLEQVDLK